MEYLGYVGSVVFDDEAGIFHGDVINTRDVITFQGESVAEIRQAFRDSVDDYLEFCADLGEAPEKPMSGKFNVRITPRLHAHAVAAARSRGMSLNALVERAIEQSVDASSLLAEAAAVEAPAERVLVCHKLTYLFPTLDLSPFESDVAVVEKPQHQYLTIFA